LLKGFIYHPQLFLVTRMGDIDDMQQDIRLAHLVQRALEALHQVMRQLADKTYGIAEKERHGLEDDLPGRGIERGEELVFREDVAFAQKVHQGGFTHIGISYQRDPDEFAAVLALRKRLFINFLKTTT